MYNPDPRTKLIAVMLLTIVIFFIDKILVCVSLVFILLIFRIIVSLSLNRRFKIKAGHTINFLLLAAFIILLQTFFGSGLIYGLVIACRIFSLMLIFPILTETTSTHELAASLNALGINYRISFIITTAFNQVPQLKKEAGLIIEAQKLRGISAFEKRLSFFGKISAYAGICLPLVLCAMRKARDSSVAMESRAFGVYKTRSWLEKPRMKIKDYFLIFVCVIFIALLLLYNNVYYQF